MEVSDPNLTSFVQGRVKNERVRSSGLLISTGTGSTAWLKTMSGVNYETLSSILDKIGVEDLPENQRRSLLNEVNERVVFPPDHNQIYYKHREIVQDADFFGQGFCNQITLTCRTQGASIFLDSKDYEIQYGDVFKIQPAEGSESLSCIQIQ